MVQTTEYGKKMIASKSDAYRKNTDHEKHFSEDKNSTREKLFPMDRNFFVSATGKLILFHSTLVETCQERLECLK